MWQLGTVVWFDVMRCCCCCCVQHKLTWQRAVQEAEDGETRAKLFEQLYQLSDVILDGFRAQLDSIKRHYGDTTTRWNDVHERYTSTRGELLEPFSEYTSARRVH